MTCTAVIGKKMLPHIHGFTQKYHLDPEKQKNTLYFKHFLITIDRIRKYTLYFNYPKAVSSVVEHLPYKQRVTGSKPVPPNYNFVLSSETINYDFIELSMELVIKYYKQSELIV